MNHYKSWGYQNKQLADLLCDKLKERVSYFLTRYQSLLGKTILRSEINNGGVRCVEKRRNFYNR